MRPRVVLIAFALTLSLPAFAADTPKVTVAPVARINQTVTGQDIVIPEKPDIVVAIATFPPGARLPEHKHPWPHLAYVLDGVLTVTNTETGKVSQVKKGDFTAEMENTWHYGVNNGTVPVRLLVIDEVPRGTKSNVVMKGK